MSCNKLRSLAFAVAVSAATALGAEEKVWSAVVLASKVKKGEPAKPVPAELVPFAPRLAKVFGYDQFEILGSATKAMDGQTEHWLVPTQNFWVGAKATRANGGYRLNLEFFHDKRCLVETVAVLGSKSPLFVRGPMHPRGQLIMVFEIRP
jgi:hypothetical protein